MAAKATKATATCPDCAGVIVLPVKATPLQTKIVCPHCRRALPVRLGIGQRFDVQRA